VSRGLHALGKGKLILVASGTAAGINIILNVFFIELYGVVFALYSSIISYLFAGILIMYFSYKNEISQRKTIASGALCLICATGLLNYV
jgi:Na+-driven multidrug efflux pump